MLARLTRPRLLTLFFVCLIVGNVVAQAALLSRRDGMVLPELDMPVASDFVVFYSAGAVLAAGDGRRLYDLDRLRPEEEKLTGRPDLFIPFAYPAFYALLYVPLSHLPFFWALGINVAAMAALALAAISRLRSVSPAVRSHTGLVALGLFAYAPFFDSTLSGQNAALSLLCVAGAYAALVRGQIAVGGVWLGLLCFKPQIALPLLALMVWRRNWRAVAWAAAVAVSLVLLGAVVAGPTWPWQLQRLVGSEWYLRGELACCALVHVDLSSVALQVFRDLGPAMQAVVAALTLAIVVAVVVGWRRGAAAFPLQFGLTLAAALLVSPHALMYETTLLLVPLIALVDHWRAAAVAAGLPVALTTDQRLVLVGVFAAGYLWRTVAVLGVQPAVLVPVAIGFATWRALGGTRRPLRSRRVAVPAGETGAEAVGI